MSDGTSDTGDYGAPRMLLYDVTLVERGKLRNAGSLLSLDLADIVFASAR